MHTLKKTFLLFSLGCFLLIGCLTSPLLGQTSQTTLTPGMKKEERKQERKEERDTALIQTLKEKLDLSNEQVAKLKDIMAKNREQLQKDRQATGDDRKAFRKLARERKQNNETQIKALLTPEQAKKFDTLKEEMRGFVQPGTSKDQPVNQ